jgi:hypothetical protein
MITAMILLSVIVGYFIMAFLVPLMVIKAAGPPYPKDEDLVHLCMVGIIWPIVVPFLLVIGSWTLFGKLIKKILNNKVMGCSKKECQ